MYPRSDRGCGARLADVSARRVGLTGPRRRRNGRSVDPRPQADTKPNGEASGRDQNSHRQWPMLIPRRNLNWYEVARGDSLCVKSNMLPDVVFGIG